MDQDPMEMALTTDVVMDNVLRHLKARDLLSCRLVSKFWNKEVSYILRRRSTMIEPISEEKDLKELQMCMETSLDFPFAGLNFNKLWKFNSDRVMKFSKKYGERFTRLCLDHCWAGNLHDLAPFIGYLPRLSILEIKQSSNYPPPRIRWSNSAGRQECGKILKLPSLRIIRLPFPCRKVNENVLREVLEAAASPLLRIECLDAKPEIVRILKSAGRLRAISAMKFDRYYENNELALQMGRLLSTEPPSLTKLDFNIFGYLGLDDLKKILSSSQNTLQELNLDGIYSSEYWTNFPVLPMLTKLSVRLQILLWSPIFHGSHGQKFPALKEFHLCIQQYCAGNGIVGTGLSDGWFVVPSVTTIDLDGCIDKPGMEKLAQSFPNITELRMNSRCYSGHYLHRSINSTQIWNVGEFKCLEKLLIWNYQVERPSNGYINMDSFLTGIPVEMCEILRKQKQLDPINNPDTETLRCNPSILQVENLKELIVCLKPKSGWEQLPRNTPFISMVSIKYALEKMPYLRTKFVYENDPSPPSYSAKQDIAALEGAFKDVQPFVKLERFYY